MLRISELIRIVYLNNKKKSMYVCMFIYSVFNLKIPSKLKLNFIDVFRLAF